MLRPQSRFFTDPPTETNEAAIETFLSGQLYTVARQGRRGRALAAAAVVEAAGHADLVRRRAGRTWRAAGAPRARAPRAWRRRAFAVSRALRLLPIILLALDSGCLRMATDAAGRPGDPLATRQPRGASIRLPAGARRHSGLPLGRSGNGRAALAQFVRELVRAVRRRSAGPRGAQAAGAWRSTALPSATRPAALPLSSPATAIRTCASATTEQQRAARAGLCRRPRDLHRRWQGRDPPPVSSGRSGRATCRRSSPSWRRRGEGARASSRLLLAAGACGVELAAVLLGLSPASRSRSRRRRLRR